MSIGNSRNDEFKALNDHGKVTTAEVLEITWREKKHSNDDRLYSAVVKFTTSDGRVVTENMPISAELGRAYRQKTTAPYIEVRYLPETPSVVKELSKENNSSEDKAFGRLLIFAGLGLIALRFAWGRIRD